MRNTQACLGGIGLVAALLLAGCGSGPESSAAGAPGHAAPQVRPNEAADGDIGKAVAPGRARDAGDTEPAALARVAPEDRAIIHTATVRVRARDVDRAAAQAEQIISAVGGYVHDGRTTTERHADDSPSATITFKVPTDQYREVLDDLGSLGTRLSLQQQAQDVTQEVADVESRLSSARASLDRLRQLMTEAETIGDVLSVEREIAEREAELESLEARQRTLASKTQYATVTLELVAPAMAKKQQDEDTGFLAGLAAGWRAFGASLGWLVTKLGALLPFLVAFGAVGYAGWRLRIMLRRRRTAPAATAPSPPPAS